MKKKMYVALLTLCCPVILNTQQAIAEETPKEAVVEAKAKPQVKASVTTAVTIQDNDGYILTSQSFSGEEGKEVAISLDFLAANGYVVQDVPINADVQLVDGVPHLVFTFDPAVQHIVITVYAWNPSGDASIKFVDDAGNAVVGAPIVTLGGQVGEPFSYEPHAIAGYTYNGGTVTGTLTDTLQTITVVYDRVETNITASFVDEDGNKLADDQVLTGKFGETSSFTPLSIADYELVSKDGAEYTDITSAISVKHGEKSQNVTLTYRKKSVATVEEPAKEAPAKEAPAKEEPTKEEPTKELPVTSTSNDTPKPETKPATKTPVRSTGAESTQTNATMLAIATIGALYYIQINN